MLSEIISKVAVNIVGILIILAIFIPGIFLTINYYDKIEKILIKKNTPKWIVSTLTFFFVIGGVIISGIPGVILVDYLGLEIIDILYPLKKLIKFLKDFLHISSFL